MSAHALLTLQKEFGKKITFEVWPSFFYLFFRNEFNNFNNAGEWK